LFRCKVFLHPFFVLFHLYCLDHSNKGVPIAFAFVQQFRRFIERLDDAVKLHPLGLHHLFLLGQHVLQASRIAAGAQQRLDLFQRKA